MIATLVLLPLSTVIADRFAYYLIPIQAMIFARASLLNLSGRKLFTSAPYVILFLVFLVWSYQSGIFQSCYLPYRTWLFGFPEGAEYVW